MTILETQRLTLRALGPDDAAFVLELLNDPGWIKNIGPRDVQTLEAARTYIAERFKTRWFAACDAQGMVLGVCGIIERPDLDHPDIGYAFLERHSGQGYATEAASAVLRYGLETLGLPTILAITDPDNVASQRVLEKIGLRFIQMIDVPGYHGPSALFTT